MNCQQARKIQIIDLLASMGIKPLRCKGAQCFYAIDSNDKHPNLTVNTQINKFFDFRNGSNGGPIDFIMTYNNCSLTEALRILSKSQIKSFFSNGQKSEDNETGIFIKKVKELENKALTDYLSIERKLPLFIAKKYLEFDRIIEFPSPKVCLGRLKGVFCIFLKKYR